ncbi:MAG: HAMP domain-containing histidine kinase [Bacteroidales bacterium]|nr:HAMP domain-containing histidine kinase [Bacteroidales bacterium]
MYRASGRLTRELDELNEKIACYTAEHEQLLQSNEDLKRNNIVKDKLLSIISHDLRSPVSSLQALLNIFHANNIARKDLVDFFGKLLVRVENISIMLENLLRWSNYQLNDIQPIFNEVNIQEIMDDSINFYRMQAEQKRIAIGSSHKTVERVNADVEMLKIILRNLISNALKFTREGGSIMVNAVRKDNEVVVSVEDTGIGISPENQEKMFNTSSCFTTIGTAKEKGTGFGLLLCRDFVEHNRGKLWLESEEGKGTTFYFSIPSAIAV